MFYVFFLFWSANVLPITTVVVLLQLFIPMSMVVRRIFLQHRQFWRHWLAFLLILAAVLVCFGRIFLGEASTSLELKYSLFFVLSTFLNVLSMSIKEGLVINQAVNNEKFNFKISISQLLGGLLITPIVVQLYMVASKDDPDAPQNLWLYLKEGIQCIGAFSASSSNMPRQEFCQFSLIYILGYAIATFLFQTMLKAVSPSFQLLERPRGRHVNYIFSMSVPLTILGFLVGYFCLPRGARYYGSILGIDFVSVGLVLVGVFLYNVS